MTELKDVISKWFKLGIFLEVPSETLIGIKRSGKKEKECKLLMLIEWSKRDIPTWEKLVAALIKADLPTVAVRIATNHREFSATILSLIAYKLVSFSGVPLPASMVERLKGKVSDSDVSYHNSLYFCH